MGKYMIIHKTWNKKKKDYKEQYTGKIQIGCE